MSQRTADQLRRLKRENLATLAMSEGVEVSEEHTKDQIISALDAAGKVAPSQAQGEQAPQSAPPTVQAEDPDQGVKRDQKRSPFSDHEHVQVIIHSTDDEDGSRPVDVTVNGYNFRIPRDQEVRLPRPALEVLEHAVETRLDEVGRDPVTGAPQFRERKSRRFAFGSRAA